MSLPAGPGQSPGGVQGAKPPETLKIVQFSTLKKKPKIHSHGAFFCDP